MHSQKQYKIPILFSSKNLYGTTYQTKTIIIVTVCVIIRLSLMSKLSKLNLHSVFPVDLKPKECLPYEILP
jgi:hypothetical protein